MRGAGWHFRERKLVSSEITRILWPSATYFMCGARKIAPTKGFAVGSLRRSYRDFSLKTLISEYIYWLGTDSCINSPASCLSTKIIVVVVTLHIGKSAPSHRIFWDRTPQNFPRNSKHPALIYLSVASVTTTIISVNKQLGGRSVHVSVLIKYTYSYINVSHWRLSGTPLW
jgi:hypothetical protein